MAEIPPQQTEIELDLSNVPADQRSSVKQDVGEFIVDKILTSVGKGVSPVAGFGKFKELKKDYAEKFKGGNLTANLELEGDMLAALDFKKTKSGVAVGIFDDSQAPKADGHNNFSGLSPLAKIGKQRRFIPKPGENKFKKEILDGVNEIVSSYEEKPNEANLARDLTSITSATSKEGGPTSVTLGDIFNKDLLAEFLLRKISRG